MKYLIFIIHFHNIYLYICRYLHLNYPFYFLDNKRFVGSTSIPKKLSKGTGEIICFYLTNQITIYLLYFIYVFITNGWIKVKSSCLFSSLSEFCERYTNFSNGVLVGVIKLFRCKKEKNSSDATYSWNIFILKLIAPSFNGIHASLKQSLRVRLTASRFLNGILPFKL